MHSLDCEDGALGTTVCGCHRSVRHERVFGSETAVDGCPTSGMAESSSTLDLTRPDGSRAQSDVRP